MASQGEKWQVNPLILKELIKGGYSLEGNVKFWNIADSKLWYLTPEQAEAYLNMEKSERIQKNFIKTELKLIEKNIKDISELIKNKNINIIDLGCGNGKKAAVLIKNLKDFNIRYCPVDINSNFIELAIENAKKARPKEIIKIKGVTAEFENIERISEHVRNIIYPTNVFLLLGNTLENLEIHGTLFQIRRAMKEGDVLLIGDGLDNQNPEELLNIYGSDKIKAFLDYIPKELGFEEDEIEIKRRFRNSRVEIHYEIKVGRIIDARDRIIELNKGDNLLVFFSYKYNKDDLRSILKMYFSDVNAYISKDDSYTLVLCKK